DLPAGLLALAQALSVTERQLHGSLLNNRRVVSRICGALFRGSLTTLDAGLVPASLIGGQTGQFHYWLSLHGVSPCGIAPRSRLDDCLHA
ncbi:hypothetical protein LYZ86_21995, partial [Xanthomonas hortorum pv. cynarae]|uniref:hypothetical protein n=1 Tax=Xanthomonas hortorum TaxID=56454 RepID=UPI001F1E8262